MKKSISFILSLLIMISLFSSAVYAADNIKFNNIVMEVEKVNLMIQKEIEKSVNIAEKEMKEYQNEIEKLQNKKTNEKDQEELSKIDNKTLELQGKHDSKINEIINKLIKVTNRMSQKVIEKAAKEGITVTCELIEVEIGGRTVLVDPLIVLND